MLRTNIKILVSVLTKLIFRFKRGGL